MENADIGFSRSTITNGALTQQELANSQRDFGLHYSAGPNLGFTADLAVPFHQIQQRVLEFMQDQVVEEEQVALQFFHRFNTSEMEWYVCMQMCKMEYMSDDSYERGIYSIQHFSNYRYDIFDGNVGIQSSLVGDADIAYASAVYYKENIATGQHAQLQNIPYVKSIIVPWKRELLALLLHNYPSGNPSIILVLKSIARLQLTPDDSPMGMTWPHSIAFHLRSGAVDNLGIRPANAKIFYNHAADISGLCPPNCDIYFMPSELPTHLLQNKMQPKSHVKNFK